MGRRYRRPINELSEKISNGYEFRNIPIIITKDYEASLVRFVREDTGEVYSSRPMTAEERQGILDAWSNIEHE